MLVLSRKPGEQILVGDTVVTVVPIPEKRTDGSRGRLSLRLDPYTHAALSDIASVLNIDLNGLINKALGEALPRYRAEADAVLASQRVSYEEAFDKKEAVCIGDDIRVTVVDIGNGKVRLGVEAGIGQTVARAEMLDQSHDNKPGPQPTAGPQRRGTTGKRRK